MGEAAIALRIIGGAGVDEGIEAEDWGFGPLTDDEGKAVRQDLYVSAFFEAGKILGRCAQTDRCGEGYDSRNPNSHEVPPQRKPGTLTIPKAVAGFSVGRMMRRKDE
jgi:hypothetical protein